MVQLTFEPGDTVIAVVVHVKLLDTRFPWEPSAVGVGALARWTGTVVFPRASALQRASEGSGWLPSLDAVYPSASYNVGFAQESATIFKVVMVNVGGGFLSPSVRPVVAIAATSNACVPITETR
jgi:hypothetical protein